MTETERFLETMRPRITEVGTAIHNGDPGPWMAMWSRTEPLTLFGAVKSGRDWGEIAPIFSALGQQFSNCLSYQVEIVAAEASGDLAYVVALEHTTIDQRRGANVIRPAGHERVPARERGMEGRPSPRRRFDRGLRNRHRSPHADPQRVTH